MYMYTYMHTYICIHTYMYIYVLKYTRNKGVRVQTNTRLYGEQQRVNSLNYWIFLAQKPYEIRAVLMHRPSKLSSLQHEGTALWVRCIRCSAANPKRIGTLGLWICF